METIPTIREFISKELLQRNVNLTDETPLIEDGYLTSLQTVDLVMFLNERFAVEIEPEDVNETQFRSLRTIAELVRAKRGE